LKKIGVTLVDGALLNNNPIKELIKEVDAEFPDQPIDCIVSIGTGMVQVNELKKPLIPLARSCAKIATDTEQTRIDFEETSCVLGRRFNGKYFRFNVSRGLERVGLEEWKEMETMWSKTMSYLKEEKEKLSKCVLQLARAEIQDVTGGQSPPVLT